MTEIRDRIKADLADAEYRHAYAQEFLDMTLARQIRALRKQRGWSQAQLAEMLNTKQSRISEMENEEYGALSIASLKDLARVFDVYLNVRFSSFAELLSQVDRTSMEELSVAPYADDPAVTASETFAIAQPTAATDTWLPTKPGLELTIPADSNASVAPLFAWGMAA